MRRNPQTGWRFALASLAAAGLLIHALCLCGHGAGDAPAASLAATASGAACPEHAGTAPAPTRDARGCPHCDLHASVTAPSTDAGAAPAALAAAPALRAPFVLPAPPAPAVRARAHAPPPRSVSTRTIVLLV